MAAARVAIVVLNYNGRAWLEKFLPTLWQHRAEADVFVADNGSTDGSLDWVADHFGGQVTGLALGQNLGFCRGYNRALAILRADFPSVAYYALVNSDVEVTPGWLPPLVALLDQQPRLAACQPNVRAYHRPSHFEYAGAAGGRLDRWGFPFCRGRLFDELEADTGQYADATPIFWATGACLVVRANVYHQLGGLDDDFFAHMEEIDFCWRAQRAGYGVSSCGTSTVYHVGGGTLPRQNPAKTFYNFRNGLAMLHKNLSAAQLPGTLLVRLLLDGLAGGRFLLAGQPAHCAAIVRAHFAFYATLPRWHRKRRAGGPHPPLRQLTGYFDGSVAWRYFVQGKKTAP